MRFTQIRNAATTFGSRTTLVRPCYATLPQFRRHYGSQDVAPGGPPQPGKEGPDPDESSRDQSDRQDTSIKATLLRMFESSATTFASIVVLGYDSKSELELLSNFENVYIYAHKVLLASLITSIISTWY